MTPANELPTTVTIGGDLTVGRIGYGAMQLTGPKVCGEYPDHDKSAKERGSSDLFGNPFAAVAFWTGS